MFRTEANKTAENIEESTEIFQVFFANESISEADISFDTKTISGPSWAREEEVWVLRDQWALDKNGNIYEKVEIICQ